MLGVRLLNIFSQSTVTLQTQVTISVVQQKQSRVKCAK